MDYLISREWLKTAIHNFFYELTHIPEEEDIQAYIDVAPVIMQHITAHWTKDFTCSYCGCKCYPMDIDFGDYNYCPNCGAEMKEGEK